MSLAIEVKKVTSILLASGWHDIKEGSMAIDAFDLGYVYTDSTRSMTKKFETVHFGNTGFTAVVDDFLDPDGQRISGPISSVLAVRVSD